MLTDEERRARDARTVAAWAQLLESEVWTRDLAPFLRKERRAYANKAAQMGLSDGDRAILIGVGRGLDILLGRADRMLARLQRARHTPQVAGTPMRPPMNADGPGLVG